MDEKVIFLALWKLPSDSFFADSYMNTTFYKIQILHHLNDITETSLVSTIISMFFANKMF